MYKKPIFFVKCLCLAAFFSALPVFLYAQAAPGWISNLERAYPSREWVAVTAQGTSQPQAESAAMNALARAFRTDVSSLTNASQAFTQIVDNSQGSRSVNLTESQNFSQEINTSTNVSGLLGVQLDVFRDNRGNVHVCARMNRRESAARYSGMIRENSAIINTLLAAASPAGTFDAYARLSFAHALAQATDSFQNILEVLDTSAAGRRPGYGGAASIRARMMECASLITIGVAVTTENPQDRTLFTRALGSFFRDRGFQINESGTGNSVLRANVRFEEIRQNIFVCRYFIDAALTQNGNSVFSFTENDRRNHPNSNSEARRLSVQAVEESIKEAKFAREFDAWLFTLIE